MGGVIGVAWRDVFYPDTPLIEIFVRGTITYLFIFALLRVLSKREAGAVGITDLLVVVLIADAAQNAMSNGYESISDGLLLVTTIAGWDWFLSWVAFHSPPLARLIRPAKLLLIRDGSIQRRSMRKELITEDELMSQLRLHGIEDTGEVKEAYVEADGRISVIGKGKEGTEDADDEKGKV